MNKKRKSVRHITIIMYILIFTNLLSSQNINGNKIFDLLNTRDYKNTNRIMKKILRLERNKKHKEAFMELDSIIDNEDKYKNKPTILFKWTWRFIDTYGKKLDPYEKNDEEFQKELKKILKIKGKSLNEISAKKLLLMAKVTESYYYQRQNTEDLYKKLIERYPKSPFSEYARIKLIIDWTRVQPYEKSIKQTINMLEDFIIKYPKSNLINYVKYRLASFYKHSSVNNIEKAKELYYDVYTNENDDIADKVRCFLKYHNIKYGKEFSTKKIKKIHKQMTRYYKGEIDIDINETIHELVERINEKVKEIEQKNINEKNNKRK